MRIRTAIAISLLVSGCSGSGSDGAGDTGTAGTSDAGTMGTTGTGGTTVGGTATSASTGPAATDSSGAGSTTGAGSSTGSSTGGGDPVCDRWNADRANLSEGTWTGSLDTCDPGDLTDGGRQRALAVVNLYRFLADLPPVTDDAARNQKTQACALMMDKNGMLSHNPPMSWACYSAEGAEAAGKSNIALGVGAVASVDLFMVDPGNATTLGHRRWILSNSLGPIGLGGTPGAACMWVLGGSGDAGKPYVAWPPAGKFPLQAVAPNWTGIDETGWSIQSDAIDLSGAQVTITKDGAPLPVSVTQLSGGYGSQYAISMIPQGWNTTPGTYHVEVMGVATPIAYDVEVVDCGG